MKPLYERRFATREDIANAVHQQMARFTYGAANAEADGIQCIPHHWQRVVTRSRGLLWGSLVPGFSCKLYVYCVIILLHREGHIAQYSTVIN
ncbi:hypothetical protein C0J52_16668 [Blattella germanica]|nr:hypothetical protein C0J52_16668 [Blattella germanica]